jgi:hypothetical protein
MLSLVYLPSGMETESDLSRLERVAPESRRELVFRSLSSHEGTQGSVFTATPDALNSLDAIMGYGADPRIARRKVRLNDGTEAFRYFVGA